MQACMLICKMRFVVSQLAAYERTCAKYEEAWLETGHPCILMRIIVIILPTVCVFNRVNKISYNIILFVCTMFCHCFVVDALLYNCKCADFA